MSAVNLLSSLQEKPADVIVQDGHKHEGYDEGVVGAGCGDPAVLAVGPVRRPLTYSRDELLKIRNSPLVKQNLEGAFAGCEALALVLKRRSDSPNDDDRGARGDAPNENHKGVYGRERDRERRSADPRERVRKESEPTAGGIVLSPQRRSFTSGCGAPAAPPPRAQDETHHHPAPKPDQGRRIGSGRIMVREAAWEEGEYRAAGEPYRPPPTRDSDDTQPAPQSKRFERRSYGRDSYSSDFRRERDDRFSNEKLRDRDDRRGGRFSQRRLEKEDEPEWFSGGPTSQLETIELRGFDEPAKKTDDTSTAHNNNKEEKWTSNNGNKTPERWRERGSPAAANDSADTSNDKDSGVAVDAKPEENQQNNDQQLDFNIEDFLKFDSIPEVLTNGGSENEGSRFSRWFQRESPTNDSRHYERLMHNMVDDLDKSLNTEQEVNNARSQSMFTPISPERNDVRQGVSLLELLRRASTQQTPEVGPMGGGGGKMQSLEELEARLRPQPAARAHEHDLSAFKRLLAQVSGGHAVAADVPRHQHQPPQAPQPPQPPLSLMQMLNKSIEQQKAQQPQQPHIPQELLYKLLHLQQRQQQQQSDMTASMAPDRELLQRPEAQAIIHGLKVGEITVAHVMQQLGNPGLQSRHRDLLLSVLRLHHQYRQMGGSPLPAPAPPHLVVPPHHQPLRLSPLPPHPGAPARIPSPRELAAHTQSIMQGALIKKKLEEQRENYRRRHEMQQQPKQPTPISFTPTSVLRKMTAEKEVDAPSPKQQQWAQPPKVPQGRPIVKGNQSGMPPQDYPHAYFAQHQQQMASGVRQFPHPQQRQQIPNSLNNLNNATRGIPGGTTLHQLLVQSHQRSLNEMGGSGAGGAGGDNQLARWFSPELLARASAGKLPSVHVPNALSLEELERHHHSPAPPVRN